MDSTVPVPISKVVDLAVEAWRLERWLGELNSATTTAPARYALRRFTDFFHEHQIETIDLTGQPFEAGLALEVLGTTRDSTLPVDTILVDEMVAPICLWQGNVVRHGRVVTRSSGLSTIAGDV